MMGTVAGRPSSQSNRAAIVAVGSAALAAACAIGLATILVGVRHGWFSITIHNYCGPGPATWGGVGALAPFMSATGVLLGLSAAAAGGLGAIRAVRRTTAFFSAIAGVFIAALCVYLMLVISAVYVLALIC